ncbi:MAG: hypothetical protein GY803_29775, partial [Chloroflexi bacterium]|nr:hypothetical protein [Chloroflexota bacterium]
TQSATPPLPTATSLPTNTLVPSVTPSPTPVPSPTISPTSTQEPAIPLPPGIIYQTDVGIWQVDENGVPALLFESPGNTFVNISPDGKRAIVEQTLIDFETGDTRNLDFSEDYVICCAAWWPQQPDVIFAEVQPGSEWTGMGFASIPAAITVEKGEPVLHLLGENPTSYGPPSIAPNGQTVAFDQAGIPWLFNWNNSFQPFDIASFDFPELETPFLTHPSWSNNSTRLTWTVAGTIKDEWQSGIGIFDLQNQTSQFLSSYEVEGFDGGRSVVYWNPNSESFAVWNHGKDILWIFEIDGTERLFGDNHSLHYVNNSPWNANGEWLVYTVYDSELEAPVAFVTSANGTETHEVGVARNILWSPDGKWLVLGNSRHLSPGEKWLVEVGAWEQKQLNLPEESYILDWIAIAE